MTTRERLGLPSFADEPYLERVRARATALGSDGCSGPTISVHVDACYEHDVCYGDHQTVTGQRVTRAEADRLFRERIQERSPFGVLSPMSWWRWAAVRIGGYRAYHDHDLGTLLVSLAIGVVLLLTACAAPVVARVPVTMRCDPEQRDAIDCKLMEFNCRNAGRIWTGTTCVP